MNKSKMTIERIYVKVRDLCKGYVNDTELDEERGVYAYGGKLCVRPEFQRSFVYDDKQSNAVIDTVLQGFPLSIMYWVDNGNDTYDCLDGQQRTISLCDFFSNEKSYHSPLIKNNQPILFEHLQHYDPSLAKEFEDYEIEVYVCRGSKRDQMDWFNRINIAGVPLTEQEIRNSNHTSKWLTDAKRYFSRASKSGKCPAEQKFGKYTKADANRQLLLEQVIKWRVDSSADEDICAYMVDHMKDDNATDLWNYFNEVVDWVLENFGEYDSGMKGIEWGFLYNAYGDLELDPEEVTETFSDLMTAKKTGELTSTVAKIVEYCITGNEQLLSHRAFTTGQRTVLYKRQNGICPDCGEHFIIEKMDAHHIQSWRSGGVTVLDNGVMLCKECHHKRHGY